MRNKAIKNFAAGLKRMVFVTKNIFKAHDKARQFSCGALMNIFIYMLSAGKRFLIINAQESIEVFFFIDVVKKPGNPAYTRMTSVDKTER